jgi:hypothetical protein
MLMMKLTKGGKAYQAQYASMKPIHEKKKTRPYGSVGLRIGTERAFLLIGLTSGALQRLETFMPIFAAVCKCMGDRDEVNQRSG